MATLNANMNISQGWVPLSESDANAIEPGHYTLDDEYIVVSGPHIGSPGRTSTRPNGRWVTRATAGSTAATHLSGATLTRYYPDAPGGEGGGTPTLAEVLAEGNTTGESDLVVGHNANIVAAHGDGFALQSQDGAALLRVADAQIVAVFNLSVGFGVSENGFAVIGLPTADPSIEGALWIDTGAGRVLKVSAG